MFGWIIWGISIIAFVVLLQTSSVMINAQATKNYMLLSCPLSILILLYFSFDKINKLHLLWLVPMSWIVPIMLVPITKVITKDYQNSSVCNVLISIILIIITCNILM